MDVALGNRLIDLRARIAAGFRASHWEELGLLTGGTDIITGHDRLLRSLSWGDVRPLERARWVGSSGAGVAFS